MKKLITLLLVLTGMVSTASATQTIYLIPSAWDEASPKYGAWVCESSGSDADQWVAFSDSGLGFWTATFNDSYTKIVLGRFNSSATISGTTFNIDGLWTQSEDIIYNSAYPVYTCTKLVNNDSGVSATALYKLYVKDMDDTSNTAVNLDSWTRGNSYFTWPGRALGTETISEVVWNVFYWPFSTIGACFTKNEEGEDNWRYYATGGETLDLSTTKYYYYYPSCHEFVDKDDALAEATTIRFRTDTENDNFDTSKYFFWNCEGINENYCFSDVMVNGYKWKSITTHKPTFNIQFYSGDGGNEDGTKTDNPAVTCVSGETAYYVYRLSWGNNTKLDSKFYVISTDNANGGNNYLAKLEMSDEGNFVYKATIDNVTTTNDHYFEIAPVSALDGDKSVSDYSALIYSTNWDYDGPTKNPYAFTTFTNQSVYTMKGKGYNRWKVTMPLKYDIYYNFATAKMTIEPYFEKNIYKAANGYATFSSDKAVAIPDGVTAKFTTSVTSGTINWTTIANGIPADQGALLYSAAAAASANDYETYKFTPATTTDDLTGNLMKPIASKTQLAQSTADNTTNFILSKVDENLGFYKVNDSGSWCNAGTAYLQVANGNFSPARAFFLFDDDSNTTAIEAVKKEQKMNGEYYNLAGQRVAQPTKGLYIVNGKKVIVK